MPPPPQEREGGEASATVLSPEPGVPVPPATPVRDETLAGDPPHKVGNAEAPSGSVSQDLGPIGHFVQPLVIVLVAFVLLVVAGNTFGGAGIAGLLIIGGANSPREVWELK